MKLTDFGDGKVVLEMTSKELAVLRNAMNEVSNGIHIDDRAFSLRVGIDRAAAQQLTHDMSLIVRRVHGVSHDG